MRPRASLVPCLTMLLLAAVAITSITATVRTAGHPAEGPTTTAQIPSPALFVVNKAENTLAVIDPATGAVTATIPTGDGPHEVTLSADGRTAYVTNYGAQAPGSSLSVIDLLTRKEIRRVDLGPLRRPHGVIVLDGLVYFTIEANRAVARYDPSANAVDWLLGTGESGTHMLVATPGGSAIFTSNIGSDSISAITRTTGGQGWTMTRIPVGRGPEGLDVSPDGKELWTAHLRDGGVSIIDVASRKVVHAFDIGTKRSNRLRFTPDGRLVLVSDLDAGDLVVLDAATRKEVKRMALGRGPSGILIVPDGSRAYVALTGENALAVVDLKTLEPAGRIATGTGPDGMAWLESAARQIGLAVTVVVRRHCLVACRAASPLIDTRPAARRQHTPSPVDARHTATSETKVEPGPERGRTGQL